MGRRTAKKSGAQNICPDLGGNNGLTEPEEFLSVFKSHWSAASLSHRINDDMSQKC